MLPGFSTSPWLISICHTKSKSLDVISTWRWYRRVQHSPGLDYPIFFHNSVKPETDQFFLWNPSSNITRLLNQNSNNKNKLAHHNEHLHTWALTLAFALILRTCTQIPRHQHATTNKKRKKSSNKKKTEDYLERGTLSPGFHIRARNHQHILSEDCRYAQYTLHGGVDFVASMLVRVTPLFSQTPHNSVTSSSDSLSLFLVPFEVC